MRRNVFLFGAALAIAGWMPAAASAAIIADFELDGSLANSGSGGATLTNNGGTLGGSGITFGLNQGPSISGLGALSAYTIDMGFTLDSLNGPRGNGYVKLIDFSNLSSDAGYYSYNGYLNAYPLASSANPVFAANTPVRLTLSRDNAGLITAYINSSQIYSQSDSTDASGTIINALDPLTFFTDDFATGQGEASAGFVDYIRISDTALTPGQIGPAVGGVPEPASWAMMIVGFAMIGAGMRYRKRRTALRYI